MNSLENKMSSMCLSETVVSSKLECPVCYEVLMPPIFQCFNGHLLCDKCISAVKLCPVCRDILPEKKIINLALGILIQDSKRPCPFSPNGCKEFLYYNKEEHQFLCDYAFNESADAGKSGVESGTPKDATEFDPGRAEASFSFTVDNIFQLKNKIWSPPVYVRHLPWRILVLPNFSGEGKKSRKKTLGVLLQCDGVTGSTDWSVTAKSTLRLFSHLPQGESYSRDVPPRMFCSTPNNWGYTTFLDWTSLVDPSNGYINKTKNSITLDVHVEADLPLGVAVPGKKHRRTK